MAGTIEQQVSDPYAEALLSIGSAQGLVDRFGEDMRFILAAMATTPELQNFLASPVIKTDAKKAFLQQVLGDQVHPLLLNMFKLLTDRRRIVFLSAVCQKFLDLQRRLQRIALAEVTSAIELTDAQKQSIIERVQQFNRVNQVELQTQINPDLIGGVIIKVGSQVIDLSLRGQLRRLALQLG